MGKTKNFKWIVENGLLKRLKRIEGNPLFVVDTGAIIDLERDYRQRTCEAIQTISEQCPLIITEGVLEESEKHNRCYFNHGKEISDSTLGILKKFRNDSLKITNDCRQDTFNRDLIKYAVYSASVEAFSNDFKKGFKDEISRTDKELISEAYFLAGGNYCGEPISSVNILSPDDHIEKTVKMLESTGFNYSGVNVLHTRKDLKNNLK